ARAAGSSCSQLTIALRFLSGSTRTFLLAGFALNVIFSPVKGLTPSRALVAGFFTTLSFIRPGTVNRPLLRRLFLMVPPSESNTEPTCLRERPVSFEICVRTSDFVGAPPFFAIFPYSSNVCDQGRKHRHGNNSARKIAHRSALASIFSFSSMLEMAFFPVFAHRSAARRHARAGNEVCSRASCAQRVTARLSVRSSR